MYNVRRIYLKYQVTKYQVTNLPHVKILADSTSFLRGAIVGYVSRIRVVCGR